MKTTSHREQKDTEYIQHSYTVYYTLENDQQKCKVETQLPRLALWIENTLDPVFELDFVDSKGNSQTGTLALRYLSSPLPYVLLT